MSDDALRVLGWLGTIPIGLGCVWHLFNLWAVILIRPENERRAGYRRSWIWHHIRCLFCLVMLLAVALSYWKPLTP